MKDYGKRVWFFPDGDRPPFGDSELKGHESVVVLNPNDRDAHIRVVSVSYTHLDVYKRQSIIIIDLKLKCA